MLVAEFHRRLVHQIDEQYKCGSSETVYDRDR